MTLSGTALIKQFSKNIDFSLLGKQFYFTNCTIFNILEHCEAKTLLNYESWCFLSRSIKVRPFVVVVVDLMQKKLGVQNAAFLRVDS